MTPIAALFFILAVILGCQFCARLGLAHEAGVRPTTLALALIIEEGVRFAVVGAVVFFVTPMIFSAAPSDAAMFAALAAAIVAGYWTGRALAAALLRLPGMARINAARTALADARFRRLGYVRAVQKASSS